MSDTPKSSGASPCSVIHLAAKLDDMAITWESNGDGRLDAYRAGYADALRIAANEIRIFSQNEIALTRAQLKSK